MDEEAMLASLAESRGVSKREVEQVNGALEQKPRYDQLMADARTEVQRHPAETVRRRLLATVYFWFGADWFKNSKCWETESTAALEDPGYLIGNAVALILNGTLLFMLTLSARLGAGRQNSVSKPCRLRWLVASRRLHPGPRRGLLGPRLPLDGVVLATRPLPWSASAPYRAGLLRSARL